MILVKKLFLLLYMTQKQVKYDEDADQASNINIHNKRSNTNQHDTDQNDQDCRITPYKEVPYHTQP